MEAEIKVLVADDSAFMRRVITDILEEDGSIEVVGTAKNGKEALELMKVLNPDVVVLDIDMPVMNGLDCLKEAMKTNFVPVVMFSSLTRDGENITMEALENGAVDFIAKPSRIFDITSVKNKQEIIEKVKIASRAVKTLTIKENGAVFKKKDARGKKVYKYYNKELDETMYIVAIGISTGGPKSLQEVIPLIPRDIPAAFMITQHMPPGFTRSLAERLNSISDILVKEAEDDEIIYAGRVYIAPGDYHMQVIKSDDGKMRIKLSHDSPVGGHRPSIDVMMDSISNTGMMNVIGIIMTGMGKDGIEGIKKLKQFNRGYIIAQDKNSCIVYGMPRIAVETGVVDAVIELKDIAKEIIKLVGVQ